MLAIAETLRPPLDASVALARLDALAGSVTEPSVEALCATLFGAEGFRGQPRRLLRTGELLPRRGARTPTGHSDLAVGAGHRGGPPGGAVAVRGGYARPFPGRGGGAARPLSRCVRRRPAARRRRLRRAARLARRRARRLRPGLVGAGGEHRDTRPGPGEPAPASTRNAATASPWPRCCVCAAGFPACPSTSVANWRGCWPPPASSPRRPTSWTVWPRWWPSLLASNCVARPTPCGPVATEPLHGAVAPSLTPFQSNSVGSHGVASRMASRLSGP